jgi:ABC-type branched-subunit amino acid transport system substrate-binding protein
MPYATKIKSSGAQAVLTGNWGNDLTLLVRSLREVGSDARLYTFYGNALGVPAAIGEAGIGAVLAVAEWQPNVGGKASDDFYAAFKRRFPEPKDDYVHARMQVMVEMLAAAIERSGSTRPPRWRARSKARASMLRRSAGCTKRRCAPPTTSCSSRWSSASWTAPAHPASAMTSKARASASARCAGSTPLR